jgi:hypothetical protein
MASLGGDIVERHGGIRSHVREEICHLGIGSAAPDVYLHARSGCSGRGIDDDGPPAEHHSAAVESDRLCRRIRWTKAACGREPFR